MFVLETSYIPCLLILASPCTRAILKGNKKNKPHHPRTPKFPYLWQYFHGTMSSSSSSSSAMDVVDSSTTTASSEKTVAFAGNKLLHLKF